MTGMIYRLITTSAVLCLAASTFTPVSPRVWWTR
jgi:hypothetical protein